VVRGVIFVEEQEALALCENRGLVLRLRRAGSEHQAIQLGGLEIREVERDLG
jgi:hypothetical protein